MHPLIETATAFLKRHETRCRLAFHLLTGILVVVAGVRFVDGTRDVIDLAFADETAYMGRGLNIPHDGVPNAAKSSLYSIWYLALSNLAENPTDLFYLNFQLMTVLLAVLTFAVLRRLQTPLLPATLAFVWVLISQSNHLIQPKPTHFATVIALATLLVATFSRSLLARCLIAMVGMLLCSFARPEFFYMFMLTVAGTTIYALVLLIRQKKKSALLTALGTLATCIILISILGNPAFDKEGNRSMVAFGQHYGIRWVAENKSPLNPANDWKQIVQNDFGDADSIGEAARKNPKAFNRHLSSNLSDFFPSLWKMTSGTLPLFQVKKHQDPTAAVSWIVILFLAGYAWPTFLHLKKHWKNTLLAIAPGLPFLAMSVVPLLSIFPRPHYMIVPFALLLVTLTPVLFRCEWSRMQIPATAIGFCILLAVAFGIKPVDSIGKRPTPNRDTVDELRKLQLVTPVNLLDAEGGYATYLGEGYTRYAQYRKTVPFEQLMSEQKINAIVVSGTLMRDSRFVSDPQWQQFLRTFPSRGYKRVDVKSAGRIILAHESILPKAGTAIPMAKP